MKRVFKKMQKEPEIEERTVFNMKVGDIVTYDLMDYQVVGKLSYNDHGFQWHAYQLEGTDESIWLSVEMDDELELGIYRTANLNLTEPIPDKIEYNERTYHLDEKGIANVRGEGRGKNVSGMNVRYFDLADNQDENFLSIEIWGSEIEVSEGFEIDSFEIKILAGS
ncbi:DUF4178 domain-containing protein [Bacillus solimangrovi]